MTYMRRRIVGIEKKTFLRKCLELGRTCGRLVVRVLQPNLNEPVKNFARSNVGFRECAIVLADVVAACAKRRRSRFYEHLRFLRESREGCENNEACVGKHDTVLE